MSMTKHRSVKMFPTILYHIFIYISNDYSIPLAFPTGFYLSTFIISYFLCGVKFPVAIDAFFKYYIIFNSICQISQHMTST